MEDLANDVDDNIGNDDEDLSLFDALWAREPLHSLRSILLTKPHLVRVRTSPHQDRYAPGVTPLLLASYVNVPLESIQLLHHAWPQGLRETYNKAELPIHSLVGSPYLGADDEGNDNSHAEDDDDDDSSFLSLSQQQLMKTAQYFIQQWPESLRERDECRRLPLQRAVQNPHAPPQLIRLLVHSYPGAARQRGGPRLHWTFPLHDAILERRSRSVVQCIFEAGPHVATQRDAEGRLPLHVAASDRHVPEGVLQYLVDRGPPSLVRERDGKLQLPLFLAACAGAHEHAQIILEAWPESIRERNEKGCTPIHIAVSGDILSDATPSEVVPTARVLLEWWPEAAHDRHNRDGRTPLHEAVETFERGGPALVRLLVAHSPQSLHTPDGHGQLPLHGAVFWESARILLELGPDATRVADHQGRLPAHTVIPGVAQKAAFPSSIPTIVVEDRRNPPPPPAAWTVRVSRLLVEAHPESLLVQDHKGWVPLHALLHVKRAPVDAVRFLVEAQPLALQVRDQKGRLPLHVWLSLEGWRVLNSEQDPWEELGPAMYNAARILIEAWPEALRVQDHRGCLPLHALLEKRAPPVNLARIVVEAWPEALLVRDYVSGMVPLGWLLTVCLPDSAWDLVRYFVETMPLALQATQNSGQLPLHDLLRMEDASLDVARILVEASPEALEAQGNQGWTPLHLLLEMRELPPLDLVRYLVETRPQVLRVPDRQGRLPMHVVASRWKYAPGVASILVETWPESLLVTDHRGRLPLHVLLESVETPVEMVRFLVETQPTSLQVQDNAGRLALHLWLYQSEPPLNVARVLVETWPGSLQVQDQRGWVPLFVAVANRGSSLDLVRLLVEAGPSALQSRDPFGLVPLQVAAAATMTFEDVDILFFLARQCPELFGSHVNGAASI